MARRPYERRDSESDPAFAAFVLYRDMADERSLVKVAEVLGKSETLMSRWSVSHSWRKRVIAYDLELDRRKHIGDLKAVEGMRRRQTKLALDLQDLGGTELAKLIKSAKKHTKASTIDTSLVLKLIEAGSKLERVVRGEPGEIIETHTGDAPDLSGLTLEELRVMRRVREKLKAGNVSE